MVQCDYHGEVMLSLCIAATAAHLQRFAVCYLDTPELNS